MYVYLVSYLVLLEPLLSCLHRGQYLKEGEGEGTGRRRGRGEGMGLEFRDRHNNYHSKVRIVEHRADYRVWLGNSA